VDIFGTRRRRKRTRRWRREDEMGRGQRGGKEKKGMNFVVETQEMVMTSAYPGRYFLRHWS